MAGRLTELFPFRPAEPFYEALARRCYGVVQAVTGPLPCRLVLIDADEHSLDYEFGFGPPTTPLAPSGKPSAGPGAFIPA